MDAEFREARMVPVNRPMRQALATVVLFALTVVPTVWIAAIAWRINRPGHVRDVEIELGRRLGLQVTLQGVRYPRPGEVVYRGIVLRQEEPRGGVLSEIARADEVRLQWGDREMTLYLENPRLRADSPGVALAQLGAWIQRSGQIPFERISLAAPSCEVDLGREDLRYAAREVAGEVNADPTAPTVRIAYRMSSATRAGSGERHRPGVGTHCELILIRDRRAEPVLTSLAFKTIEGLPLPARVLSPFFDVDTWLGANATVEGTLELRQAGSKEWEAIFSGNLHNIDLAQLIGHRFPRHRLMGRARLAVATARWGQRPGQGPGWIEAKGELLAGQGSIGVSLLQSLAREMRFRLSSKLANLDPRKTEVDFRAMGLAFDMRANGEIHLAGALGAEGPPDAILAGVTSPLASTPQGTVSVHGLIKTLFPVADASPGVLVPLTPESSILLALPVPPEADSKVRRAAVGN
jgi:hypothetical protein